MQSSTGQSPGDGVFESLLKRLIPESPYDWSHPECVVKHGDVAAGILDLAERKQADLIVLGAREAEFCFNHTEGCVTFELLAQATCPLMTVCWRSLANGGAGAGFPRVVSTISTGTRFLSKRATS
jgi:hypothetical protein